MNSILPKLKNFIVKNRSFLIYFAICFFVYSIWLLAYYPGALSYDSISQWDQVQKFEFSALTSPLNTYIMYLLSLIWNNPVIVSIFQITCTSLLYAYLIKVILEYKVSKKLVNIIFILLILSPVIGIHNVTLWKDIFYSQLILLLGILWVKDCIKGKIENKNLKLALFSIVIVMASLMRLNGLVYLVFVPFLYLFTKLINFKTFFKLIVFIGVVYILLGVVFPKIINVKGTESIGPFSRIVVIQIITAIANSNGTIEENDLPLINQIGDFDQLKNAYKCSAVDYLLINAKMDLNPFITDPEFTSQFDKMAIKTMVKNLPNVLADRVCLFSHLIGLGDPKWATLYYTAIESNTLGIEQRGISFLNTKLDLYLTWSSNFPQRVIFWTPLFYILFYLIYLVKSIYQHNRIVFGYTLIILVNLPVLFVVDVFTGFRYLYMLPFGFFFLFLIDRIKIKKTPHTKFSKHHFSRG